MKTIILRADDICAYTDLDALKRVYDPCWERGWPVCLSVIPRSAYQFSGKGIYPAEPHPITENSRLVNFIAVLERGGLVEVMMHGWEHHWGELVKPPHLLSPSPSQWDFLPSNSGRGDFIRQRLEFGLSLLHEAWPGIEIKVLVPPHDYLSHEGLAAAKALGLQVCSTWAATHGGKGWIHWQGKLRRRLGWDFAPPEDDLWPTDIMLLDFEGDGERDWPETRRLLQLGERWSSPVVFVQHYWQLETPISPSPFPQIQGQGEINQSDKFRRWMDWLMLMEQEDGIHFTRFSDILGHHHHA